MNIFSNKNKIDANKSSRGFTLIELIVSISIIVLLSIALFIQQNKFDSAIFLKNTTQEVALIIRQAQSYATRGANFGSDFDDAYGIYINIGSSGGNDQVFYLFQDKDEDGFQNKDIIERYTISGSNKVSRLCSNPNCSTTNNALEIMFERPDPEALMTFYPSVSSSNYAEIVIQSSDGTESSIIIRRTGQITVE